MEFDQVFPGDPPTVDNFATAPSSAYQAIYGNQLSCERGIYFIDQYEERKKIDERNFEFTFRFTDAKLAVAEECN